MLIPDRYREILELRGFSLQEIGSAGSALAKSDALEAVDALKESQVAILGGDVVISTNGKLRYAKENWYIKKGSNEDLRDYLARSRQKAEDYIQTYPDPGNGTILYALIVSELGT